MEPEPEPDYAGRGAVDKAKTLKMHCLPAASWLHQHTNWFDSCFPVAIVVAMGFEVEEEHVEVESSWHLGFLKSQTL